jgi:hypothetical protein
LSSSSTIKSWSALAREIGIAQPTLVELRRHDEWPASVPLTVPAGGFTAEHVESVRQWREGLSRATLQQPDADDSGDMTSVNRAYKLEQTALTRVRRELLEGRYIETQLHEAAMLALADRFIASLTALQQSVPLAVPDLTPEQRGSLERVMAEQITRERQRIADEAELRINLAERASKAAQQADVLTKGAKGRPARGTKANPKRKRGGK